MGTIQFKEVNCKNCYKCIRSCPVKAISFSNDHARVIEDECILCGKCLHVCPQNAKHVINDIDKVKGFIDKKHKVYASIAPSFAPAFNIKDEMQMSGVFRKLGFTYVEETAVGAEIVSAEYKKLLLENKMTNIITTACPTIVSLIEKHYPELISQLAPVVSPMIAHAKMMKELYGSKIKVVFIGPCLSKKEDYKDLQNDNTVDAVLTFEEFETWLKDEGLSFNDACEDTDEEDYRKRSLITRFYPAPGGILQSLGPLKNYKYRCIKFDGIEECMDILNQIEEDNIKGYFIEMNSCTGGCLGGPCMNSGSHGYLMMREKLISFITRSASRASSYMKYDTRADFSKVFVNKSKKYAIPTEKEISAILNKIGKFSKEDELNCGTCGYPTCRDKAIAVYNGKAELHMCLPYMRERAESISNIILNLSPNAIFALNEDLTVNAANSTARKLFRLDAIELRYINIFDIINCPEILTVMETKNDIYNMKCNYDEYGLVVEQSIIYVRDQERIIIFIKDITKEENNRKEMLKMQYETAEMAQKVIDKQMVAAQEIASLLGETTAETKVVLTKLKKAIESKIGETL